MQPHIRIGDAERDRVCAVLRELHAAGRIGLQELPTRLAAAQTAVTWGDLYALTRDLPPIPGMPLDPSAYPAQAPAPAYPTPWPRRSDPGERRGGRSRTAFPGRAWER